MEMPLPPVGVIELGLFGGVVATSYGSPVLDFLATPQ